VPHTLLTNMPKEYSMHRLSILVNRHVLVLLTLAVSCGSARAVENRFVGNWALTIPDGGAGWLGIREEQGKLAGSILWGGGSVVPVSSVRVDGNSLVITRATAVAKKTKRDPAKSDARERVETIRATLDGDSLNLTTDRGQPGSKRGDATFVGNRIPPVPKAPDLSKVKFGEPITLFNGKDLAGWRVMSATVPNGWSVKDGVLVNDAKQEPGKHISYANLTTEREFKDFRLTLDVRVPKGGNSGVYLRGIYEVQVADTYGRPLDSHNMGGVYSRIAPTAAAEKPAGEWQTLDLTLVNRHVTVILNGTKIIDNQPLLGCTGGALWSDEFRAGPIYLQGDHTSVDYRNIVLRPVAE
jgi:hypothetical protein